MIADDRHGVDLKKIFSNLTDVEKINIFDELDARFHDDTNLYMSDRIAYLEGQINNLTKSLECHNEDIEFLTSTT
jgi:hypothetical protein